MLEFTSANERTDSQAGLGSSPRLLEIDAATFRARFNRSPFLVRHQLADHPLFDLRRLVELSGRLADESIRYTGAHIPIETPLYDGPRTGLSTQETIRRIAECGSWMVLKNVEIDPEYRALLDTCLDQIRGHSESIYPGMCQREGFIFVSSPGVVTPYHMDPEHNFLLQIRGEKQIYIWDGWDRSVLSEIELEKYFSEGQKQLVYKEEYRSKAAPFALSAGDGVHVPVATPHWVQNGADISISFSITFRSHASKREQNIHRVNRRLRKLGFDPSPYATSPWLDSAKHLAFLASRGMKRLLGDWLSNGPGRMGA